MLRRRNLSRTAASSRHNLDRHPTYLLAAHLQRADTSLALSSTVIRSDALPSPVRGALPGTLLWRAG